MDEIKLVKTEPQVHVFNTGRHYSEHGQRIAWTVLSTGNVLLWDRDRMIDYILDCPQPTNPRVLDAYDKHAIAPFNRAEYDEAQGLLWSKLDPAARMCKSLKKEQGK